MEDLTHENPDMAEQEVALADDAVPVCPACLEPCNPLDNYCSHCGSNEVINPLASYMPFVDLRFKLGMLGKLWQKTWRSDTAMIKRAIGVCVFLLFYPFLLLIGLPFVIYEKMKTVGEEPIIQQESE